MFKRTSKESYPVLLLRDIVIFPGMIAPLFVGRSRSVSALESALAGNRKIFLVTQQSPTEDDPPIDKIYKTGIICSILQLLKLPDGTVKALIEGETRASIKNYSQGTVHASAEVVTLQEIPANNAQAEPLMRTVIKQFGEYLKLNRKIPPEMLTAASQINDASKLADALAGYMPIKISEKQELLEDLEAQRRLEKISAFIEREIGMLQTESKIRSRVRGQIDKNQKDYYLNEQMKAIQRELDEEDGKDELASFEKKINELKLSEEAKEKALSELKKFKTMSPLSAEATVIRNYLDWITSIPWNQPSEVKDDIVNAEEVLEAQHYALGNVKERILEYLAVQTRTKKMKGPILCLVGPPGVGKTSLGRSIA
jgi:ATP-dependent Lon protease